MRRYIAYDNNCLQCCLAALLDMPLEDVITREELEDPIDHWTDILRTWLNDRGYYLCFVNDTLGIDPNACFIHVVETKDGIPHGLIWRGISILYDSRPNSEPYDRTLYAIILIPLGDKTQQHEDISEFEDSGEDDDGYNPNGYYPTGEII